MKRRQEQQRKRTLRVNKLIADGWTQLYNTPNKCLVIPLLWGMAKELMKSSKGLWQPELMPHINALMLMHLDQKAKLQDTIQNWFTFNVDVVTTNLFGFLASWKLKAINPKFASRGWHENQCKMTTDYLIIWTKTEIKVKICLSN